VLAQRAYLNALFTARIADIQRRNLVLADERLAQVQQLEKAGRASRYDVLRARVERANLEPLALQAEAIAPRPSSSSSDCSTSR
jgi:outer membrane protein TolC